MYETWGRHNEHLQSMQNMIFCIYCKCLIYDTLSLSFRTYVVFIIVVLCANIFCITQKSLGGHAKTSVTSPLLKIIKFYVAGTRKFQYMWKISR